MARGTKPKGFPYPVQKELGPFVGVRDRVDPFAVDPTYLSYARNIYPDSPTGGAWRTRPAIPRLNLAAPLGTAGARAGQCVFQHTALDGTEYTVCFGGGKMYRYDWSTGLFTDKTPGGIVISQTSRIYCVTFADYMMVHDGVNRPWKYNWATSTASYLTDLAYALYGPWAVYYAKLFAIKNSERNKIVWSEELDPDTGYENVLYLNRWTLGQTDQEGLEGLAATNAALYYFRPTSIGTITGAVTSDFQSQGTRDGVSTDVGTRSPASIYTYDDSIWFVDTFLRQYRIAPGDQVLPLWPDAWKTYETAELTRPEQVISAHAPGMGLLLTTLPLAAQKANNFASPSNIMVFTAAGNWCGTWAQGLSAQTPVYAMGVVKNLEKAERLMFLDNAGLATLMDSPLSATLQDSNEAIFVRAVLPGVGESGAVELEFDELSVVHRPINLFVGGNPPLAGLITTTDGNGFESLPYPVSFRGVTRVGLAETTTWLEILLQTQTAIGRFYLFSAMVTARAIGPAVYQGGV